MNFFRSPPRHDCRDGFLLYQIPCCLSSAFFGFFNPLPRSSRWVFIIASCFQKCQPVLSIFFFFLDDSSSMQAHAAKRCAEARLRSSVLPAGSVGRTPDMNRLTADNVLDQLFCNRQMMNGMVELSQRKAGRSVRAPPASKRSGSFDRAFAEIRCPASSPSPSVRRSPYRSRTRSGTGSTEPPPLPESQSPAPKRR